MSIDLGRLVAGALIYTDADQSGAWIEVTFAHNSVIDSGANAVTVSGGVIISEGSAFTVEQSAEITTTPVLVISSNSNRTKTTIHNDSGIDLYYGDQASLSASTYEDVCPVLAAGDKMEWKNSSGMYFRKHATAGGNPKVKLFHETK